MIVSKTDAEIGIGASEVQGGIALLVEEVGAGMQLRVVLFPRGYRIGLVGARRGKDGVPKPGHCFVLRQIGEYGGRPGGSGARYDGPINLVVDDQLERRAVRLRSSPV